MQVRHLFVAVAGILLAPPVAADDAPVARKVNAMLCDTETQAISLATALSSGKTEPIAVNTVNKAAGAEVCGRFIGYAIVEVEKTENKDGSLFMLAGLRFTEDGALGWTASWVRPFDGLDVARGI
ncbi:hypothetical protein [Methyloceanibacter sp.]|uniref:hypothetical protein n=1 Tax=Methyloceanibacter sp. TaxID=1965321 RepID=UPI002BA40F28|nr:hypothetical protein [Methyloceanibacter sp.]HML91039.1 hypothetical protein [Methyloceanibacter sp.]